MPTWWPGPPSAETSWPPTPEAWPCLEGVEPVDWIDLNDREGMDWSDWRLAYLAKHEELGAAIEARAR